MELTHPYFAILLSKNRIELLFLFIYCIITIYLLQRRKLLGASAVAILILFALLTLRNFPSIDLSKPKIYTSSCHTRGDRVDVNCVFGDINSGIDILLTGDSHAAQYFPVLEQIAINDHYKLTSWTKSSCPFLKPDYKRNFGDKSCQKWQESVWKSLVSEHPRLVVISNLSNDVKYVSDRAGSARVFNKRTVAAVKELRSIGISVLYIEDFPKPPVNVVTCLRIEGLFYEPQRCNFPVELTSNTLNLSKDLRIDNFSIMKSKNVLCPQTCLATINKRNVFRDDSHLSIYGALLLYHQMNSRLRYLI